MKQWFAYQEEEVEEEEEEEVVGTSELRVITKNNKRFNRLLI